MPVLTPEEMAAWSGFLRAHKVLITTLDTELQEAVDMPLVWYDALVQLHLSGGSLRMKEFADRLLLSRSATTRFVDRLEGAGLVARTLSADDRRGMTVSLTTEGHGRLRAAAGPHLDGVRRHFLSKLGKEEIDVLAGVWARLLGESA